MCVDQVEIIELRATPADCCSMNRSDENFWVVNKADFEVSEDPNNAEFLENNVLHFTKLPACFDLLLYSRTILSWGQHNLP